MTATSNSLRSHGFRPAPPGWSGNRFDRWSRESAGDIGDARTAGVDVDRHSDRRIDQGEGIGPCLFDGARGDAVILAPPYITTREQLREISGIFAECVRAALHDIGRG